MFATGICLAQICLILLHVPIHDTLPLSLLGLLHFRSPLIVIYLSLLGVGECVLFCGAGDFQFILELELLPVYVHIVN